MVSYGKFFKKFVLMPAVNVGVGEAMLQLYSREYPCGQILGSFENR